MSGTLWRNTVGWIPGLNGLGKNAKAKREARSDDVHVEIFTNADTKKKTPVKKHNSPTFKLFIGFKFSVKNFTIYPH